jgi:hypothetical protein
LYLNVSVEIANKLGNLKEKLQLTSLEGTDDDMGLKAWRKVCIQWHYVCAVCFRDGAGPHCCTGCCSIDVWGIMLNILLQDAPFLGFRLLLIVHYRIISYMNVFFTCKNTLVIVLQLYR